MLIRQKLTLTMMGISLAAVILTVLSITAYLIYDIRLSKVQELKVTAALTGDRNSAALVFLDAERARQNLEIFHLNPSILAACIYNAKGALFASYKAPEAGINCPLDAKVTDHPGMLSSLQPIRQNGETIGSVYLASNMSEIDTYIHKILMISFTVTLVVLAITTFLTAYFQQALAGPILELAATAKSITERGDYTLEAREGGKDETGILAHAFNAMLSEVRKRDQALMRANETLEQKVAHRTHQLEEAKTKAEAASAAKSEFLRNMSHEFRTPLHAIISFSAYGIKEFETSPPAQLKQYFELIQKGSERLARLVGEVLELARMEHGNFRFLLRRGDMYELASRSVEMVQPLLKEKNITLAFDPSSQSAETVCDHDKIMQVITNLLGNAIKFTPSGRQITLHTHREESEDGPWVVLSVTDQGIGVPETERESIFESFHQSSRTNTGAGGTGLGLAICRGIVETHGGKIWLENNTSGPGARVTFRLPAALKEGTHLVTKKMEVHHENAA